MKEIKLNIVNYMKGSGIILVVLGHAISGYMESAGVGEESLMQVVYDLVESFQMPLFFMLSGFLFAYVYKTRDFSYTQYIKKRIINLGIPYILGSCIYVIFGILTRNSKYTINALKNAYRMPISHFWFLYILLIINVFTFCISFQNKRLPLVVCIIVMMWIVYHYCSFYKNIEAIFPLNRLLYYTAYFGIGELCAIHHTRFLKFKKKSVMILLSIVFVISFAIVEIYQLQMLCVPKLIISLTGTVCFMKVIDFITKNEFFSSFLLRLGSETMPIYMFHSLFVASSRRILFRVTMQPLMVISICTVIGVLFPYGISKSAKYISAINLLFYPSRFIKKKGVDL